jgi:hypothetical protein
MILEKPNAGSTIIANSSILNGVIQEEVYVIKPLDFKNPKYPNRVYKLSKALYRLKQAPRAWYPRLTLSC